MLEGILTKATNKVICKTLRNPVLFIKNFKYYYFPLLLKLNFTVLIIAIAFFFLYKVLGGKKSSKGNIKLATWYTILMAILTLLEQLLTSVMLKLISILVDKA